MSPAMAESHPHLAWETSANFAHPTISDELPDEVATCLRNARFVRLLISDLFDKYITNQNVLHSYISQPAHKTTLTYL